MAGTLAAAKRQPATRNLQFVETSETVRPLGCSADLQVGTPLSFGEAN